MRLCIYKCYLACTVILGSVSDIFENYSRAYSRIFSTFCIPGIFRTLAYSYHKAYSDSKVYSQYHIKHFHKSSILDVWYSSECTSVLKMLYFTVSLTLYFRHILAFSRFVQPYLFLLRHIKSPSILKNILLQRSWGMF